MASRTRSNNAPLELRLTRRFTSPVDRVWRAPGRTRKR